MLTSANNPPAKLVPPPKNKFHALLRKTFGDREFVRTFWKLLTPSIAWGIISSIVPLLFNLFTASAFTLASGKHGNLYVSINYTYETFTTVNYLATIFVFSLFPAIGNFVGHGNFRDFKETMRFSAYVSFTSAAVLMLCEEIWAQQYSEGLVFLNSSTKQELELSVLMIRPMAFIGFFFVWIWLYVPSLSSIKNNRPLIYSAIISFVFFIITDTSFIFTLQGQFEHAMAVKGASADTGTPWDIQVRAAIGMGWIYLVYFAIQPIFIYLYLKFYYYVQVMWLYVKAPFVNAILKTKKKGRHFEPSTETNMEGIKLRNPMDGLYDGRRVTRQQIELLKNTPYLEKELLFFDHWSVRNDLMKTVLLLSWGNILDQGLFNAVEILHFVYSTNYGGTFPTGDGFTHITAGWDQHLSNVAANHFYKLIVSNPEMLLVFFYGVWNAFSVAPQYFIARELGAQRKDVARKNTWICMNWAYLMGIIFMIVIVVFATFINQYATFPSSSGANWYPIAHHGKVIADIQYWVIWDQSRIVMIIWGFVLISYTAGLMAFYVVLIGASKWIVFSDTLGTTLFTIIAMALHYTHFDNPIAYYFIPHLDKLFKYIVYMIIIGTNAASNSIHDVGKPKQKKKLLSPQALAANLEVHEDAMNEAGL